MKAVLWVALGSALGGAGRYGLSQALAPLGGLRLVWVTLLVNVLGSFVIGLVASVAAGERWALSPELRLFLSTGVLGGFTTFSAFSLQTLELVQDGQGLRALTYVVASVMLCLLGAWLGLLAGRWVG